MKVVDAREFEAFSPIFRGEKGLKRAEFVMRLLSIDKVNWVYNHSIAFSGSDFTSRLLDDLGVDYLVGNAERLRSLPEGAFITVSNHPYGGLDGIMTIDLLARLRPDYKFMVNKFLARIKTMNTNFISVIPAGNKKTSVKAESLTGVRETLSHIHEGHPAGFFPAGAVSDFILKEMRVRDRKWQESILRVIRKVRVPVIPIRFFDGNSPFFYFLGLINWRVRLLRLASEVFNKKGQQPRIGIGNIVPVEEQDQFPDALSLGAFLRKKVYEMPLPNSFITRKMLYANNF